MPAACNADLRRAGHHVGRQPQRQVPSKGPRTTMSDQPATPASLELRLERRLATTVDEAWRAITRQDALAAWFWPASFGTQVTADVRVGGAFELRAPAAPLPDFGVGGGYTAVDPPQWLAFSWRWRGEPHETSVEIELNRSDDGTRLSLRHAGFGGEVERDDHVQGWNDCLDRLEAHLDVTADGSE